MLFRKANCRSVELSPSPDRSGLQKHPFEPGLFDGHLEAAALQSFDQFAVVVRWVQLVKFHADSVDSRHHFVARGVQNFVFAAFTVNLQQVDFVE